MNRFKLLWKASPRRVLLAFGALMIAAALAIGSGANFNSTSANPSNVFAAGTISQSNSKANAAILTGSNLVPGNTATGTLVIKNTGSANGTFTLAAATPVDTPASPGLSKYLTLTIVDNGDPTCTTSCPAAVTLYSGTINAEPATLALGTFTPNQSHQYTFTMTFPNNGTTGGDNAYQGASTSVGYTFFSTS
jgi:spore coat-associated protein N